MQHHHGLNRAWGIYRAWAVLLTLALCLISSASFGAAVLSWSLDDGSGSIAADSSGQGNTGSVSGATWVPGRVGGALSFNGSNAALTRANVQGINTGNTPHTVAAWVKVNALPSNRAWIMLLGPEGAGSHHWLIGSNAVAQLGVWNGPQAIPTLPVGVWKHIAITFDGSELKAYIDGTLISTQAASFNLTGTALTVAQSHVAENYFNGEVDEFRIYNSALTAAEVSTLAGASPPSLAISTSTLPNGIVGSNYSQILSATGGTPPYAWSITAGSLPAGLSLNTAGTISGTPSTSGTSNFTVRVTDATNATSDRALTLTIANAPSATLGIVVATDNTNEVYLNGVLLGTASNWTQSSNYSAALQSGTNVLAVKAIDTGGPAGLIAELTLPSGKVVSDASWKVSVTAPAGWEAVSFNDSAWSTANQYGAYGSGPWFNNVSGFPNSSTANWIWTADNNNDDTAYFRYTFTVGSAPPPNVAPTVSLTGPADGSSYTAPADITLTANAADSDGTITAVEFYNGATLIGSVTTSPYTYTWSNVPLGNYSVRARAIDNQGGATYSNSISINVTGPAPPPSANVYYLYTDHLNTPRVITDTSNTVVWRWDSDPFGTDAANEDPDGDGTKFRYNPRFPGQYFDKETGLHYNYFRDYEPTSGRYIESDPIGLEGGLNTYAYVGGNPISKIDPYGLIEWKGIGKSAGIRVNGEALYTLTSECVGGFQMEVIVSVTYASHGGGASWTTSSATFTDKFNYINPYVFDGPAFNVSAGIAAKWGTGFDLTILGGASSPGGWSAQQGIGLWAGVSVGSSKVISTKSIACSCPTK